MLKQFLETGKIVGTHGVKGAVRIQPWSDSGEFLTAFKRFYLDDSGKEELKAVSVKPHGNVVIAQFSKIDSIDAAEALRGKILYIARKDVKLPKGRYFIDDLIGCNVTDADSGKLLGVISDVSKTGANDVWHIKSGEKEYLVPVIEDVVVSVSTEETSVVIRPLKGIFDNED